MVLVRNRSRRTSGRLNLKLPNRNVNSETKGPACLFESIDGKFAERYPLAGANFLVDASMRAQKLVWDSRWSMVASLGGKTEGMENRYCCFCFWYVPLDAHLVVGFPKKM